MRCESRQDARKELKGRLGAPVVEVELDNDQLDRCVKLGEEWFLAQVGQLSSSDVELVSNKVEYDVPDDCEYVVEVIFERHRSSVYHAYDITDVEIAPPGYPGMGAASGMGARNGYSDLAQLLQYREQGRRVLGVDRDWEYDSAERKLRLFPDTIRSQKMKYWYLLNEVHWPTLQVKYQRLVKEYALACAYETLGQIRAKFAQIPSAEGGTSLNGDQLLGRSEGMKLELNDRIGMYAPPLSIHTG